MTDNVWWIAAGNIGVQTSSRDAQTGQVYLLDMTTQSFSKCHLEIYLNPFLGKSKIDYELHQDYLRLLLEPQTIVTSPGYGFTNVDWVDMDLDGHADAIGIRTRPTGSELIWMQQPPHNAKWTISTIDKDVGGNQFKTMWIKVKYIT